MSTLSCLDVLGSNGVSLLLLDQLPYANVAIYDSGRYLGTIRVDGNISVTGYNNGGWVNLNGFGTVSGAGYIDDPTPQTP